MLYATVNDIATLILIALDLIVLAGIVISTRKRIESLQSSTQNVVGNDVQGDELEMKIIELLVERGGSMYQSEVRNILGLPKSTLHKVLNRMAQKGLIEIRKEGRFNVVTLKVSLEDNPSDEPRSPT